MMSREKLHEWVETLSEEDADWWFAALRSARPGDIIDQWGNLSAFARAGTGALLRRLDEEERAEFGETIAEAWEREGHGPPSRSPPTEKGR